LKRGEVNDFDPSTPQQSLTYAELRELVNAIIPEPVGGKGLPARSVAVTYEVSGPDADEFRAAIEGSISGSEADAVHGVVVPLVALANVFVDLAGLGGPATDVLDSRCGGAGLGGAGGTARAQTVR